MKKLKPLETIFSIKNGRDGMKQITIMGFSFNLNIASGNREICRRIAVVNDKIVFMNYFGKPYGCNPKYIAEEIIKRNLPLDLVWLCEKIDTKIKKQFPPQIKLVEYKSKQCIKEMASAKFWISNIHLIPLLKIGLEKQEEQIYVQTWHGSLGIKRIENDVNYLHQDKTFLKFAIQNAKNTNYWLTNSTFEKNIFKNAFWDITDTKMINFGHPRNDIFFKTPEEITKIKNKVFSSLNINYDKKMILYAPTFRDMGDLNCYQIETEKIIKVLKEKFNGEWNIIIRMHPRLTTKSKRLFNFSHNIINASFYPDIQELLVASDIVITDYSSCIFDFMLSRKPAFIFATDIEKFNTERGFYYPLELTPFPIARNNEELIENIKNFNYEKYKNEVELFLQEKGCIEDGHASEKVVDLIEQIMFNSDKISIK